MYIIFKKTYEKAKTVLNYFKYQLPLLQKEQHKHREEKITDSELYQEQYGGGDNSDDNDIKDGKQVRLIRHSQSIML